jgi:hypothetical protein
VVLAMQQLHCGQAVVTMIGGLLSICSAPMSGMWTQIEEEIGKTQIKLGKEDITKNIHKEKKLSKTTEKGRLKLCVLIDTSWNNHGSGKSYNSDSSHHLMVGNRSNMSKHCYKCENESKLFKCKACNLLMENAIFHHFKSSRRPLFTLLVRLDLSLLP